MKNAFILSIVSLMVSAAFASGIPSSLQQLVPAGSQDISLNGTTGDGQVCTVSLSGGYTFSASLRVLNEDGQIESRRFAKFQIGFGHDLQSISEGQEITAVTYHEAEEQYSSDSRSTLVVQKDSEGVISSVRIREEQKRLLFGFKVRADETCFLQ